MVYRPTLLSLTRAWLFQFDPRRLTPPVSAGTGLSQHVDELRNDRSGYSIRLPGGTHRHPRAGSGANFDRCMLLSGEGLCRFHAASTAAQVSGAVVSLPVRGLRLNWCFLIFSASSMPRIVTAAVSNRLNPSIGLTRCFIRRWSCSTTLFKHLQDRIRSRRGNLPDSFRLVTAR